MVPVDRGCGQPALASQPTPRTLLRMGPRDEGGAPGMKRHGPAPGSDDGSDLEEDEDADSSVFDQLVRIWNLCPEGSGCSVPR
jgi:hypothetical protein